MNQSNNPAREALADLDALLILAAGARTSDDGTLAGRSRIFYDVEAASAAEKRLRAFLTRAVGEKVLQERIVVFDSQVGDWSQRQSDAATAVERADVWNGNELNKARYIPARLRVTTLPPEEPR